MCGIVGTLTPRSGALLAHRGPDGTGGLSNVLPWANLSLEMSRLAIVDQSTIPVPFDFRKSCGVVLAYNGEVYNHRELRLELSDGRPWETDCDAEVIARAWRKWGPRALHRLNGMWGLALIDARDDVVFLARDRAGEKPLYYARLGSGIAFASEIKALPVKLEEASCAELETLEFDCLETTPFAGVRCLGPGECLLFRGVSDLNELKPVKWWSLPSEIDDGMSWESAVDEAEALIVNAVRLRVVSERPVAVQLSGGLDSAIVQAIAKSDLLYTVTFPFDGVDNIILAREAPLGHKLRPVTFGFEDLMQALPKIAYHLDTPATWTACAQWFMDKQIAQDGAVVVLSGEGADETWGGYSRYRLLWHVEQAHYDPNLKDYFPLAATFFGNSVESMARLLNRGGPATYEHAKSLVLRFCGTGSICEMMPRVDFYTLMQVLLRMPDRMAAAFSLENRSPFLDHLLVEFSTRVPTKWKITQNESKAVLREVARRLGVHRSVVDEKTKRGLFIPWSKWTRSDGARGLWDRGTFAKAMREAWRQAFFTAP